MLIRPEPDAGPVLGLDVGGTKLAAGVVRGDGRLLSWLSLPSGIADGPQAVIERQIEVPHVGAAPSWFDHPHGPGR